MCSSDLGMGKGANGQTTFTYTWEPMPGNAQEKPARLVIQPVDDGGKDVGEGKTIGSAAGEWPLVATFAFAPGRQRLRFTAMNKADEVIDRWVANTPVPDLSHEALVLSTPKLLRARSMPEFRAMEANASAPATAARSFAATDRVLVEIECRGPDGVAPQVKVDLLNQKGDLLRALDAPVLQDGRGRITLPVNALANSTYVLRIEAAAGEQAAQQWVAFKVTR